MHLPEVRRLATILEKYDRRAAISQAAGMLVVPKFQANTYRLEFLVHLAVASCSGSQKVSWKHLEHWLNRQLGIRNIAGLEDPPEDVFVSNVICNSGEYLVQGGLGESSDSSTALLIRSIESFGGEEQQQWLISAYALLRVSDFVLKRAKLKRWQSAGSIAKRAVSIGPSSPLTDWASYVLISTNDLAQLEITPAQLDDFIISESESRKLPLESNQESTLHKKPLVRIGHELCLAIPTTICYAVRRYIVGQAAKANQLAQLQGALINTVLEKADQIMRHGSHHGIEPLASPIDPTTDGLCKTLLYKIGANRFIHLLILPDSLEQFSESGLHNPMEFNKADEATIQRHIQNVRDHVSSTYKVDSAHTFVALGHLGQAFAIRPPPAKSLWTFEIIRLYDLEFLLKESDSPLDKLILLCNQRQSMRAAGLHLPNVNGLLNLYAFWKDQDYCLRIGEMPHDRPGRLQIASDFVRTYRYERRISTDEHCEIAVSGRLVPVMQATSESPFESTRSLPIYVSLFHLDKGLLSFCLGHNGTTVWITVLCSSDDADLRHTAYEMWEGLQLLVYRSLVDLTSSLSFVDEAIEVILDLRDVVSAQAAQDDVNLSDSIVASIHNKKPIAKLYAHPGFMRSFSGVDNLGEQKLLEQIIFSFGQLAGVTFLDHKACEAATLRILGGHDAKIFHVFETFNPLEHLLASDGRAVFRRPVEQIGAPMRAAFIWKGPIGNKQSLDQRESCEALNNAVTHLMNQIASKLARFDRLSLVTELLHANETLLRDKQRWRSTARAVRALHGISSGTAAAGREEQDRSSSTLTLRSLVEAAVCECAPNGGEIADGHSIDELFGLMVALIEMGRDSECIHHQLASEGITIFPSGAYQFSADLLENIGKPYMSESFGANYEAASRNYENWINPKRPDPAKNEITDLDSAEFQKAFFAEYGLESKTFLEIIGALLDWSVELQSVVVAASKEEITQQCISRGVTATDIDQFLASFSLPSRPTWAAQPPLAEFKDIKPWRFERRLSVMLRPLVECNSEGATKYVFGVGAFRSSFAYILDSTTKGRFDKDVFTSTLMRAYVGRRVEELGRLFTLRVAETLRQLGWTAETEVKMTHLGAGKNPNLGDIDVVAWNATGAVLAIECKRLKAPRSVAEIAQTCNRFRGNAGDLLFKHVRRVGWLRENIDKLAEFCGLKVENLELHAPLVTNVPVPFRFIEGLPISPSDILSISELGKLKRI